MLNAIIFSFILLVPFYVAGTIRTMALNTSLISILDYPIDFGFNWHDNKRIFGANKTWRGAFFIILTIFVSFSSYVWLVIPYFKANRINLFGLEYLNNKNVVLMSFFLGLSYVFAELPNSFVKRRFDITPGQTSHNSKRILFILLDQLDSVLCMVFIAYLFLELDWRTVIFIIIIGSIGHRFLNTVLWLLNIRRTVF